MNAFALGLKVPQAIFIQDIQHGLDAGRSHRVWLPNVLELGVLGFGLSIDGKIGVGVFPKFKEFFVRFAGGCAVAHHLLRSAELGTGQWAGDKFPAQTGIVDQLLELARC